ncbi:aldo/keto reductase [Pengzhenrongella sicca]|uniref:Aldo/keto reductase n=1 Tax=Pengzhenrongella sicca TaxID=2819238 RepID=A0A8A4ZI62_9MICO|nr:aldo/keto reductase [Pengzhenrongella sicca]QTE30206.1 aldo/keto reductase [Pengzhenrongella sicca]
MIAAPVPALALRGGDIPLLGLGTWRAVGAEAEGAVSTALELGYRHLDTATAYGNEAEVGRALAASGVSRADVFVTSKLPPDRAGHERRTLERSLTALGTTYLDLWLVHWPPNGAATPATWARFIELRDEGLVRAIGVSNYSVAQLDELVAATGEAPAVNQIPWSPADFDAGLLGSHAARGVEIAGYSPLRRSDLTHPVLTDIAARHGVSPAQVVLRWHLESAVVVLPKSVHRERIAANLDVLSFALEAADVARIDALGVSTGGRLA